MIARDRSMSYSGAAAGRDLAHCAGGMKSEQRPPDNGTSATTAAILVVTVKKSLWPTSSHDHDGLHLHRYAHIRNSARLSKAPDGHTNTSALHLMVSPSGEFFARAVFG